MNKFISAALALAMIFTFSCGHHSEGNYVSPPPCKQESVQIGNQVWQKCNLDVVPTGENGAAKNSSCDDDDLNNCKIFGRLYDWATAMALPEDCNSAYNCAHLINAQHRGLCPSGWHIPSKDEWDTLINFVGSDAGMKLKAKNGWANDENGTDDYGFSALPGGPAEYHDKSCYINGFFKEICSGAGYNQRSGNQWTASEKYKYDHKHSDEKYRYANTTHLSNNVNAENYYGKTYYYGVRCLKDDGGSSSSSANSMLIVPCKEESVQIGKQVWQKCNLNVVPTGENGAATKSNCADNNNINCALLGRLYDWPTAMALPDSCSNHSCYDQIQPQHRGICPSGWHIPNADDWKVLFTEVGGTSIAGEKLKATSGWQEGGNGTDDFGFSALPVYSYYSGYSSSYYSFAYGYWWNASESSSKEASLSIMNYNRKDAYRTTMDKNSSMAVRCLQDNDNPPISFPLVPCKEGTVQIGDRVWQKCNLNVVPTGENGAATKSACYDNKDSNCALFGRLYDWATAMALPDSCTKRRDCFEQKDRFKRRGICPSGWHIPSDDDWDSLRDAIGRDSTLSKKLRATSGWDGYGNSNGEDTYGFAALPGGFRSDNSSSFYNIGESGYWWSTLATSSYSYYFFISNSYVTFTGTEKPNPNFYSVRCVQD